MIEFIAEDDPATFAPEHGLGETFLLWLWDTAAALEISIPTLRSLDVIGDRSFPVGSGEAEALASELRRLADAIEEADPLSLPILNAWRYEHDDEYGTLSIPEAVAALGQIEGLLRAAVKRGSVVVAQGD
jgi:hypothetical protein